MKDMRRLITCLIAVFAWTGLNAQDTATDLQQLNQ